jgi:hypothetical protein
LVLFQQPLYWPFLTDTLPISAVQRQKQFSGARFRGRPQFDEMSEKLSLRSLIIGL